MKSMRISDYKKVAVLMGLLFLAQGECRSWAAAQSFAIIGDAGYENKNSDLVRTSILKTDVKNLILPGDNLYSAWRYSYKETWRPWEQAGFKFDVVAIGNHTKTYAEEMNFFHMPGEFYKKEFGKDLLFLVLNSDNEKNVGTQMKWLQVELQAAKAAQLFLVYHHPSYSLSKKHKWKEKEEFQTKLRPLLQKYRSKITALIVGHDHLAELVTFGDLPVLLSGAVQEVRKDGPVNDLQDGVAVSSKWFFDDRPYWVRLDLDVSTKKPVAKFIRAEDGAIRCTITLQRGVAAKLEKDCADSNRVGT
jgi:Calcineurin-like phosphoesterase